MKIVKCSNKACDVRFRYNDVVHPIINDPGYIVIKCMVCGSLTKVRVENNDLFKFLVQGDVVDNWDLEDKDLYPKLTISVPIDWKENAKEVIEWTPLNENPFWSAMDDNIELSSSTNLMKYSDLLTKWFSNAYNYALKGRFWDKAIFYVDTLKSGKAVWAEPYKNEHSLDVRGLYLIDYHIRKGNTIPNGLHTRDEILVYLQRLLKRWSLLCNQVIIATPFIGFPYPGKSQEGVVQLWKMLDEFLDVERTTFITRKQTFTLLKKAQDSQGVEYNFLKEWGLQNPLQKAADAGKLEFMTKFHAKFYAGVYDEYVEVIAYRRT